MQTIPDHIYRESWLVLYRCCSETLQQDLCDLMDSVLAATESDYEEFRKLCIEQGDSIVMKS